MYRFLKLFLTINLVPFLLSLSFGDLLAQNDSVSKGNIIKEITLSKERKTNFIVIRGDLKPSQLEGIIIKQSDQQKKFIISLPGTLIDPEAITAPFISFGPDDPVSNIQILENINEQEANEEVSFSVDLVVKGNSVLIPKISQPITSKELKIKISDASKLDDVELAIATEPETFIEEDIVVDGDEMKESNSEMDVAAILKKYQKPSIMQISILNASGRAKRAYKLSVYLGKLRKRYIEETLGMKMDIVNISNAMNKKSTKTAIYFKESFIKPALFLSSLIPGDQRIIPMKNKEGKIDLDIEIYIGTDYK